MYVCPLHLYFAVKNSREQTIAFYLCLCPPSQLKDAQDFLLLLSLSHYKITTQWTIGDICHPLIHLPRTDTQTFNIFSKLSQRFVFTGDSPQDKQDLPHPLNSYPAYLLCKWRPKPKNEHFDLRDSVFGLIQKKLYQVK